MKENKCDVCGEEAAPLNPFFYRAVCKKHMHLGPAILHEIILKSDGEISALPEKYHKCEICGDEMTQKEIDSLDPYMTNISCVRHRETCRIILLDVARRFWEFKKTHPASFPQSRDFQEFITKNQSQ